jgi:hypothetical protein
MAVTSKDFWHLLCRSGLQTLAECERLQQRFSRIAGRATPGGEAVDIGDDAVSIAKWLIGERAITQYQAKGMLNGRAGPGVYGT